MISRIIHIVQCNFQPVHPNPIKSTARAFFTGNSIEKNKRLFAAIVMLFVTLFTARPANAQTSVAPPAFSVRHGLYDAPFQLTLNATGGAQIRYTTDFSTPTPSSGQLYNGPITISGTTVVRAIAYTNSSNKSTVLTQSYIFLAQVKTQPASPGGAWPTLFAPKDSNGGPYLADYEMDPEIINHPNYATSFDQAMRSVATLSLVTDQPNLWGASTGIYNHPEQKGAAWERSASLEWIDPTGATPGFSENLGIRLHGQASRRPYSQPKKTFRGYFTLEYGNKKLDFKLFDDNDAVSKFDRILMRGGGNRSWPFYDIRHRPDADYVNDEFVRRAWLDMGWLTPRGTYAHLYLNGLYWGLYNITERVDDRYLRDYNGSTELDYDLIDADEENNYALAASAGTLDAYNALLAMLNVSAVSNSLYIDVQKRLDVVNLADYMVMMHYVANTDWPTHNWYVWRKRIGPDMSFRMMPWDSDTALRDLGTNVTDRNANGSPAWLFFKLMTNNEFRQLLADRFYKHLVNSKGQLTAVRCGERYSALTNIVDQAVIGESARWGDYIRDVYPLLNTSFASAALPAYLHSRDLPNAYTDPANQVPDAEQKSWVAVRDYKLSTYCPQRTENVIRQYRNNGWYADALQTVAFSQEGGAVPANEQIAMINPNTGGLGEIYYTLDGSDPRAVGGAPSSTAANGLDSVMAPITQVTWLKARVFNSSNSQWSVLHEAVFYPPQPLANLVINEIHYNPTVTSPLEDGDDYEFVELYNRGSAALRLDNIKFTRGFSFQFPMKTSLSPDTYLVLAKDAARFQSRYGFAPFGEFRGNLSNTGEALELSDATGVAFDFVDYKVTAPWPTAPNGTGVSLSLVKPEFDNGLAASWSASKLANGTPGQPNGVAAINLAPLITLTHPVSGAVFPTLTPVTLTASASDLLDNVDDAIQQVVFLLDGQPQPGCTLAAPPYQCLWTPALPGLYAWSAQATDTLSATANSVPINVTVVNQAPTVVFMKLDNDSSVVVSQAVTLTAQARDVDGAVSQVAFALDEATLCVDATAPYECVWTPAMTGVYTLTAQASDNFSATSPWAEVRIAVIEAPNQPPSAVINTPTNGASWTAGVMLTVVAEVSDSDSTVAQVVFYANNAAIEGCVLSAAPYQCSFTPQEGAVQLTVQATDSRGASVTSPSVTVNVKSPAPLATPQPAPTPITPPTGEMGRQTYLPIISR